MHLDLLLMLMLMLKASHTKEKMSKRLVRWDNRLQRQNIFSGHLNEFPDGGSNIRSTV